MNDNDIIKGLTICGTRYDCLKGECPYYNSEDCTLKNTNDVLDLIDRQKAEIERLQKQLDSKCDRCIARDRTEAIKEFAKKHAEMMRLFLDDDNEFLMKWCEYEVNTKSLVKELTEDQK